MTNVLNRIVAYLTEAQAEVWDRKYKSKKPHKKLTAAQKAKAKARADKAGRPYPNLIDNMFYANK